MKKEASETEVLENVCKEIRKKGKMTGEDLDSLIMVFGARFRKAWNAVKNRRVKKYVFKPSGRVVWIVVGRERDYLVLPDAVFCSCDDFYFSIMSKKACLCYHLIGQKIAESLGWYDEIEEEDDMYDILMREWKKAIT